jgi:CHAD domain-containing protein
LKTDVEFSLPDGYAEKQLVDDLTGRFPFVIEHPIVERFTYFDTFDWRLFNNSLVLYQADCRLHLRRLSDAEILQSAEIEAQPVFVWDLAGSELKDRLEPLIKMRALLRLAEMSSRSTTIRVLNQDDKTVARLVYEEIKSSQDDDAIALATRVFVRSVRGYPGHFRRVTQRLEEMGYVICESDDIYFKAMEAAGQKPGSYTSKPTVQLEPGMRSDEATKTILCFLLQVMKSNETGIRDDVDTEFLHDFRVAVRRTRSALSQVRYVFPDEVTERFKQDFASVGEFTNELRDLDVYLLRENNYRDMLPPELRDDIDPLFAHLRETRSTVIQYVVKNLDSEEYGRLLEDWETFLNEPAQDSPSAINAGRPIIELACSRIFKRYRRIVKTGHSILENTDDEMLHALRIECKKLRYLIEFFASLYPREKIATLIDQLKRLQDNLGDFNDLCVQEEYLLNIATELSVVDSRTPRTLIAIGSLVGALGNKKQKVRGAFEETFSSFASPQNQKLFRELFSPKAKKADQ